MAENKLSLDLRYQDNLLLQAGNGKEFYYEQRGDGGPHLTMVNNFFLIAPMWRTFTGELAKRNQVLTYDLRNQGASSSGHGEVKWTEHVEDLEAILDGLRVERTYLVGTSISALICRDFAIAHPDRVAGLLLVGPACTPGGGFRRRSVTKSWINSLEHGGPAALWDHLYSMVFGEAAMQLLGTPGYLGLRETFTSLHSVDTALANLRSSLEASDEPELFRELRCPTLLLIGEDDFLWSKTSVEETERLISDVATTYLPAVGHLPYLEATAVFESAVQSFIDQVERTGRAAQTTQVDKAVMIRLRELLRNVVGNRVELPEAGLDELPLAEIGLESWAFVSLLASVEREFGIRWDVDISAGALRNLRAIAAHLGSHGAQVTAPPVPTTVRDDRRERIMSHLGSSNLTGEGHLIGWVRSSRRSWKRGTETSGVKPHDRSLLGIPRPAPRICHLVTGATGFVGAALVLELLTQTEAEVVCLVRGANDEVATARLHHALRHAAEVYGRPGLLLAIDKRTRAVAGDVTEPGCDVDVSTLPEIEQVWHSAASLKFEDRHAAEIHNMNVAGTANVIELTKKLSNPVLNYISTAYVAGHRTGLIKESLPDDTSCAHNVYEETKILAERLVAASGLRWRIMRPSVVIGHSRTRAATTFSGMYGLVSALLLFRRSVEGHFGQLLRHRHIPLIGESTVELNLIPVDYVARNAVCVSQMGAIGSVFHLTNVSAPTVGLAIGEMFIGAGLREPKFVGDPGQFTSLDKKLDDAMDFYSSYLAYGKTFDRANTDAVCGLDASTFPMPPKTVLNFVEWYQDRIRQDNRATAPGAPAFAFRKGRKLALVAS